MCIRDSPKDGQGRHAWHRHENALRSFLFDAPRHLVEPLAGARGPLIPSSGFLSTLLGWGDQEEEEAQAESGKEDQKDEAEAASEEEEEKQPPSPSPSPEKDAGEDFETGDQQDQGAEKPSSQVSSHQRMHTHTFFGLG